VTIQNFCWGLQGDNFKILVIFVQFATPQSLAPQWIEMKSPVSFDTGLFGGATQI
jgi:hypothetical protein